MLPSMVFPAGVRPVAMGGDNDEAGSLAAPKAAEIFRHRGIASRVSFRSTLFQRRTDVGHTRMRRVSILQAFENAEAICDGRSPISATAYHWREPSTLPRQRRFYGRQLLRGSVFIVIAPGATGKSALMIGSAVVKWKPFYRLAL